MRCAPYRDWRSTWSWLSTGCRSPVERRLSHRLPPISASRNMGEQYLPSRRVHQRLKQTSNVCLHTMRSLRASYGLSTNSSILVFHTTAFFKKPEPGAHRGRYRMIGRISTGQMPPPEAISLDKISTHSSASWRLGSSLVVTWYP